MTISLVDLKAQYLSIKTEIDSAIQKVLDRSKFIGGEEVKEFENLFADYCGAKHCIGVGNGTDALYISLRCLGVDSGDEVITAANTFIATAEAITNAGAIPLFTDIDEKTFNIDPLKLDKLLKAKKNTGNFRVKAIIPVHLYGNPCNMAPIIEIAREYGLKIIEDAAQAHGAHYFHAEAGSAPLCKKVGTFGDVGCFSFYPGKNLGAYGDGGAIVTDDDDLAKKMRMFSDHGREEKYVHEFAGVNSRLDNIQASVLRVKLNYLEEWTEKRRKNAAIYRKIIEDKGLSKFISIPFEAENVRHVYHLYVLRLSERDKIRAMLQEKEISTGIHYPIPLHLTRAYQHLKYRKGDFPIAEQVCNEILSMPMYPELNEDDILYICDNLSKILH